MDHLGRVHDKINYNYGRTKSFSSYEPLRGWSCMGKHVYLVPLDYLLM